MSTNPRNSLGPKRLIPKIFRNADYSTALSFNPGDTDAYGDRIFAANAAKQNQ